MVLVRIAYQLVCVVLDFICVSLPTCWHFGGGMMSMSFTRSLLDGLGVEYGDIVSG